MNSATEKFRASVAEVKDMAAQVQRELGDTRAELKRGVLDLPKETSEAADAMRRVVGDQIKALKELSAIVAPHGFDVAEPEPAPAAPPPAPPARVEGSAAAGKVATPEPGLPTATVLTIAPPPPEPEPAARTTRHAAVPPEPAPGPAGAASAARASSRAGCRTCSPRRRAKATSRG